MAATATTTIAATIAIGWLAMPGGSRSYWLDGVGTAPHHIYGVGYIINGSILGVLTRLVGYSAARPTWIAIAVPTLLCGMWLATRIHRLAGDIAGITTTAFVALLISPIAWNHYWAWFVVPTMYLARAAWLRRSVTLAVAATLWTLPFYVAPFRFVPGNQWTLTHPSLWPSVAAGVYPSWAIIGLLAGATLIWRAGRRTEPAISLESAAAIRARGPAEPKGEAAVSSWSPVG